jgi:hypothetical protein
MFTLKTFENKKYLFCNTPDYGYVAQTLIGNKTLDDVKVLNGYNNGSKCSNCKRSFDDYNFRLNNEKMNFNKMFQIQNKDNRPMYWCVCGCYWF